MANNNENNSFLDTPLPCSHIPPRLLIYYFFPFSGTYDNAVLEHHHYISLLNKSIKLKRSKWEFLQGTGLGLHRQENIRRQGTGVQSWMKLSPWNLEHHTLTKAQLPAAGVLTYPRPTHIQSFCPHLLYWNRDVERPPSFLVGHS